MHFATIGSLKLGMMLLMDGMGFHYDQEIEMAIWSAGMWFGDRLGMEFVIAQLTITSPIILSAFVAGILQQMGEDVT